MYILQAGNQNQLESVIKLVAENKVTCLCIHSHDHNYRI